MDKVNKAMVATVLGAVVLNVKLLTGYKLPVEWVDITSNALVVILPPIIGWMKPKKLNKTN